ncbi:MAG: PQQ-binding-like beta-propeller repeat protein [Planctomycetota bacterium]
MMRSSLFVLALIGTLLLGDRSFAARRGEIIPQTVARQHGLERPWFTQIQLDRARARVDYIMLDSGTLFVQTDQAVLHAIDAETGQTLWAEQVGRRGHPSLAPGANAYFVGVVNGSYLYVLNRLNGKLLWTTQLEGVPGAGPALSQDRVYVPMVGGLVYSYVLEPMKDPLEELGLIREQQDPTPEQEEEQEAERREGIRLSQEYVPPLACQSFGRSLVQPIVTRWTEDEQYVVWPTDRGFLFVGSVVRLENHFTVRYRLETEAGIAAQPAYALPNPNILPEEGVLFAASRDGFVHAVTEQAGNSLWRFSTSEPILEPPVAIGESVYAVTQPGTLYCLDAKSGAEKWSTYQVAQFIAASKDRVYVADKLNRVLSLSAASGARLDAIGAEGFDFKLLNTQTDRIYLATETGLIQCLHEVELSEPIRHRQPPEPVAEGPAAEENATQQPQAPAQPAAPAGGAADDPFR